MSDIQIVMFALKGRSLLWSLGAVASISMPIGVTINWGGPFFHALYEAFGSIAVGM